MSFICVMVMHCMFCEELPSKNFIIFFLSQPSFLKGNREEICRLQNFLIYTVRVVL
jgi:hypothetical protein